MEKKKPKIRENILIGSKPSGQGGSLKTPLALSRFASLKYELVIMAMILVLVMSGTMGFTVAWIYKRALNLNQAESAVAFTRGAAMNLALNDDWNSYPWNKLDAISKEAGFQLLLVTDAKGLLLYQSDATMLKDEMILRSSLTLNTSQSSYDGERFSISTPIIRKNSLAGAICFSSTPTTGKEAEKDARNWMLLALGSNICLMAIFLIFFLNRRLLTPMKELSKDLNALANNSFSPRLRAGSSQEINSLFDSFDQAASELMNSRQKLEKQLQTISETRDHLVTSEKMATVGRLASGLAHELGNPIGALTGFVHILRRNDLSADEKTKILEQSAHELSRMDGSIKELLHFSRPPKRFLEPVDAAEVAAASINLSSHQEWADGVEFKLETEVHCPFVMAQRNGLLQIFLNILENACQAMADNDEPKKISISIQKPSNDDMVKIRIVDSGPGIAPEDIPHLFEPYFTKKGPGQGTGLGLSISLSIVNEFGGHLDFSPSVTGGALFTISVPAAPKIDKTA